MKIYVINLSFVKKIVNFLLVFAAALLIAAITFSLFEGFVLPRLYSHASVEGRTGNIIIIDAGHGGEDAGTIGATGVLEKDLNLEVSLEIGSILMDKGYTVVYTRTEDKMLYSEDENIKGMRKLSDLKNRCAVAKEYPEAIFVSIHMNSFGASKYSGLQVYHRADNNSRLLAESIRQSVKKDLQPDNNRQVKSGKDIYVLDNCVTDAVLVECGFLSNKDECEKLSEKEYQKQLSFAIVYGIIDYIETKNTGE